jgi:hypothetical protein
VSATAPGMISGATTLENVDRRVLGAFVCVDAITGSTVMQPLPVSSAPWTVRANRSGIYVIFNGPGFSSLTTQLTPSGTWPARVSFPVTLQDPNRRYLPRRANVLSPMTVPVIGPSPGGVVPNPAVTAALAHPASVFYPQRVALYPQPSAAVGPNWSTIRASVTNTATPAAGLPWAVLQVIRTSDNKVLATGQTDANGEALLAVVGLTLQTSTSGTGPVTVSTVPASVKVYFDPGVLSQPPGWIPNPDDILGNLSNASLRSGGQDVRLASGQEMNLSFAIAV